MSGLDKNGVGFYTERKYFLPELNYHSLVTAVKTISGGMGFYLDYRGSPIYNESGISIAYGRSLGRTIQLGLQLNWNAISIKDYGKEGIFTFSAGTVCQVTGSLWAGVRIEEKLEKGFGIGNAEKWPGNYSLCFYYEVSDKLSMGTEIGKWQQQPLQFITSCEYNPVKKIKLSGGISVPDATSLVGINYTLGALNLGVYTQHHMQLGISPGLSVSMYFKKKEE